MITVPLGTVWRYLISEQERNPEPFNRSAGSGLRKILFDTQNPGKSPGQFGGSLL